MAKKKQAADMATTDAEHVQRRASQIISDATGFSRASATLVEELVEAGCIADGFNTVKQAKAAGQKSGMLRNGDTFGKEF